MTCHVRKQKGNVVTDSSAAMWIFAKGTMSQSRSIIIFLKVQISLWIVLNIRSIGELIILNDYLFDNEVP